MPEWRVPENTRFEVTDLPRILQAAGFSERYVWLDLLCIPQDTPDNRLAGICQTELARQATIFRHAATSVAWLNDVSSWRDTEAAISWIGLDYLRASPPAPHPGSRDRGLEEITAALASSVPHSCGLVTYYLQGGGLEARVPGWFSSLWTLQESMMRPDMLFLNARWEPLCVGQRDTPITLAGMVSLMTTHMRVKVGGSFFTYNHSVSTLTTTDGAEAVDTLLRGTMLPFMPGTGGKIVSDGLGVPRHSDHPSVKGWAIRADDSVELPTVGIVASSAPELQAAVSSSRIAAPAQR